jgi:hypothetical protein
MRISEESGMNEAHRAILEEEFGVIGGDEESALSSAVSAFVDGVCEFAAACYPNVSWGESLVRALNDLMGAEGQVPRSFRDAASGDSMLYAAGSELGDAIGVVANALHPEKGGVLLEDASTKEYAAEAVLTLIAITDKAGRASGGPTLCDKANEYGITLHPAYRNV